MNKGQIELYSKRSNLVLGFHGCDATVVEKVLNQQDVLRPSENDYDWLGNGIYFWENNNSRALEELINNQWSYNNKTSFSYKEEEAGPSTNKYNEPMRYDKHVDFIR